MIKKNKLYSFLAFIFSACIFVVGQVEMTGQSEWINRSNLDKAPFVDAEVVELIASPKSDITQKPLKKIAKYFCQNNILIGGVEQDGVWKVALGTTEIKPHNRVVAVCPSQNLNKVRQLFI